MFLSGEICAAPGSKSSRRLKARNRPVQAGTHAVVLFRIIDWGFRARTRARAPARTNRVDYEHEHHFIEREYD